MNYQLKSSTMYKIEMFIKWMSARMEDSFYILRDEFCTFFTREQFIDFGQEDMKLMSNSRSSHIEPHTPMTTFTGHTMSTATSESQTSLNNFKRGTKRDGSAYPIFKNDLYYDTFQRSFLAIIKAEGHYYVLLTLIMILVMVIIVNKNYSKKKQSFAYSVLVTSLQTEKGRELVKEIEGDARSILSKLHQYHTQSNVAQHEVVTLTTCITNLSLTDN